MSTIHPVDEHHNDSDCRENFRSMSTQDQLAGTLVVFLVLLLAIALKSLV